MAKVKIAISLQESLFEQVEALARELNVSCSRLLTLALEDFIHRYQNQKLLEQINNAYDDAPDPNDEVHLHQMRHQQHRIVKGEW
jgi:metal-responsive CopG/Arc/MetJ family transcriptional regulator